MSELPLTHFSQQKTVKQGNYVLQEARIRKVLGLSTAIIDGQSIILLNLLFFINACIDEKLFSPEQKKANITHLIKKDDPLDPKSYCPMSTICPFSKTFEKKFHAYNTRTFEQTSNNDSISVWISPKIPNTRCTDLRYKNYLKRNRFYKKIFFL